MRDYQIYSKINRISEVRNEFLKVKEKDSHHLKFLGMFNYCKSHIKDEYLQILQKSFFNTNQTYQFWWMDYYSKSSYYRKRFIAVNSFVSLFEMIYENFNDNSNFIKFA